MTLNFPNSAVSGQTYLGGNGVTYTFDGIKWVAAGSGGALVPISSITSGGSNITLTPDGIVNFPAYSFPAADGSAGQILTTDGSRSVYWGNSAGLSVATSNQLGGVKLGEGFTTDVNDKVTTSKLYSTNLTQPNQHYRLELDTNGVIHLPDQSIINGSYMRAIHGSYAGLAAGPDLAHNEDSWVWVDSEGTWVATKYSSAQYTWHFDNHGRLFLPDVHSTNAAISPVADGVSLGTDAGNVSITPGGQAFLFDQSGTLHLPSGGDIVDSAGNSVLAAVNQTGNYTFSGDDLEMPPRARLNSGGIGETGAAEFGTEIYKNGSNFVTSSEVYMGSGAGEFRSIYNDPNPQSAPGPSTLTYAGVEDVGAGQFSGIVSQTPGIDSMYTIAVDPVTSSISVGAATEGGHIVSADWSTTLGTMNQSFTVNGIFADTTQTVLSGGSTNPSSIVIDDQGIAWNNRGLGKVQFSAATDFEIVAQNRVSIGGAPLNLPQVDTTLVLGLVGDVVANNSGKISAYDGTRWNDVVTTTGYSKDIILNPGASLRNSNGVRVAYHNEVPTDISQLTDSTGIILNIEQESINIDGGGAYALFEVPARADGGFSGARWGSASTVFDGGANASTTVFELSLNGGAA